MAAAYLDFEKPVAELEAKLQELEQLSAVNKFDVTEGIEALRKKIDTMEQEIYGKLTSWQRVQLARHPNRPYTLDYIERLCTDFLEFHGDRRFADDAAIVGGFAKIDGKPVMVIGTQKGRNTKDNVMRNFGCPHPEGYRKALRLMQVAEMAKVPIVTFIDTPGAFPGIASEERHIGEAIAVNLREMFALTVPILCIVIGEGGSGGALAIGVGNKVMIMENAYYSVITPEGCAAILWNDRSFSARAAEALRLTAKDLLELNLVDGVIPEPLGGAHKDYDGAAAEIKKVILSELAEMEKMSAEELVNQRYERFRRIEFFMEKKAQEDAASCQKNA
ncbi:MAG: acetyl-CoA carboxylase carboxyltransferase subunit alpha [Lentisphaeria bacterium]|nr:acetyl-CoA carboxylase carboxyltransferase subunit alpha [Lentisphaeria bacterium]